MHGLERQLNLVALLAPVSTMTPCVAKGFPARAQIVEQLLHFSVSPFFLVQSLQIP
jgi:hypothetical protein